jgi:hypothetical protein
MNGLLKNSNNSLFVLFVGKKRVAHQFASLIYFQINRMLNLGEFRITQIRSDPTADKPDIIVANVEKPAAHEFERHGYLLLPVISFRLDLHESIESIIQKMSRRRRRDIKKIEASDFSYTISRQNDSDFNFFYFNMYLPYIRSRFGEATSLKSYAESKVVYRRGGGILFVERSGSPIGGILFSVIGKTLYAYILGLRQGNDDFSGHLATQAALLSLIKFAQKEGMQKLDYGISLPFFREGVFIYKKEWGMSIEEPIDQSFFALKPNSLTEGCLSFLQQNPFIIYDNRELKGVLFLDHSPAKDEIPQLLAQYFLPKLKSLILITYYKSVATPLNQAEISCKPSSVAPKALVDICLLMEKKGFKVEVRSNRIR